MNEDAVERKRWSSGLDSSALEPFVRPETAAQFLGIDPETAVRFARLGLIPGYPLRVSGRRKHWRFLLSEVQEAMLARKPKHARGVRTEKRS